MTKPGIFNIITYNQAGLLEKFFLPLGIPGAIIESLFKKKGAYTMRFGGLGGWEWIIILVIVIILFGGSKLAGVGSALGQSIGEFRDAVSGPKEEESSEDATSESKA